MVRSSHRLIGRQDIAEDIVQDLFVYIWEKQPFINADQPYSYLKKATITRTINWIKREQRIDLVDEPKEAFEMNFHHSIDDQKLIDQLEMVRNAIELLPPKCRLIFQLHRYEGLTIAEIAQYLNLSPNTVENQLGKALKLLRYQLKSGRE